MGSTGEPPDKETFELVNPSTDMDIRSHVSALKTGALVKRLGSQRFSAISLDIMKGKITTNAVRVKSGNCIGQLI